MTKSTCGERLTCSPPPSQNRWGKKKDKTPENEDHARKDDQNPEFPLLGFQPHKLRRNARVRADLFEITHALPLPEANGLSVVVQVNVVRVPR